MKRLPEALLDRYVYPMTTTTEGATMNTTTCNHRICDGNWDDPSYAFCDLPHAHAGEHHYSI